MTSQIDLYDSSTVNELREFATQPDLLCDYGTCQTAARWVIVGMEARGCCNEHIDRMTYNFNRCRIPYFTIVTR